MQRIDLKVPFAEKDHAKKLGARWDAAAKVWYVPDGAHPGQFARWLPPEYAINVRAASYFIAQTATRCWRCAQPTTVYGLAVPSSYESLEPGDDEFDSEWVLQEGPSFIHYVTNLLPGIEARLKRFAAHYYVDFSKTTQSSYWMNHCERCGMKQGDFQLYCEPQGAFFPIDDADASSITLQAIHEPFGCAGGYSYGDHFFSDMRHTK